MIISFYYIIRTFMIHYYYSLPFVVSIIIKDVLVSKYLMSTSIIFFFVTFACQA